MNTGNFTTSLVFYCSFFLHSCSTIEYLGESYTPTGHVDVYYDGKQIIKLYRVIGRMSELTSNVKYTEKEMIKKAKSIGADAIVFTDMTAEGYGKDHVGTTLKAEVIRYLK